MSKINKIHSMLTDHYAMLLEHKCEDPKMLKEIREFLRDNNINEETVNMLQVAEQIGSVELPVDYIDFAQEG